MVLDPTETQKPPSNQTRTASGTESWRPRKGRSKRSALPVDISHPAVRPLPPTEREARHFAPSLQRGRSYRRACYTPHFLSAPCIKQKRSTSPKWVISWRLTHSVHAPLRYSFRRAVNVQK